MNRTSWIIVGVTIIVCLGIGIFMLWPGLSRDWQTLKQTKQAQKELTDLTQEQTILDELSKNPELDKITAAATNYLPDEAKSSELILELSAIVSQAQMATEQISLESATPATSKEEGSNTATTTTQNSQTKPKIAEPANFTLKISGTFLNLMDFFKLMETSSRLITIQSLKISQEQEILTVDIKGEAYWKTVATAEKNLANLTVSAETLQKFANLRQYSTPINLSTEAGFGRVNPFEELK